MIDYNYEIERTMAKYGGEADKDVERTCGNCWLYNAKLNTCTHIDNTFDTSFYSPQQKGCYYHCTYGEQQRLKAIRDDRCRLAKQKRIEDNRKNGTGECEGCPFREMRDMLQKVIGLDVLAGYWDTKNNCSLRESIEKLLAKTKEAK